ncbi:hypothetical protein GCM10027020_01520 [Nocardioides salsibiostraticola]
MSSLQCPATVLLTGPCEPGDDAVARLDDRLRTRKVGHVWSSDLPDAVRTAEAVATRCTVGSTSRLDLRERSFDETDAEVVERMRASLSEIADLHPGETVLVVTHPETLRLVVPQMCRMDAAPRYLGPGSIIEIEIDAEDWVCRRWDAPD